jgi:hypothetical protein
LANGFSAEEVITMLKEEKTSVAENTDLAEGLTDSHQSENFCIVDGEEELRRIMAEPP